MSGSVTGYSGDSRSSIRTAYTVPAEMRLGRVCVDDFGTDALESYINITAGFLAQTQAENSLAGFALQCTVASKSARVNRLLSSLYALNVSVILQCHHDSDGIDTVDLSYAAGVIVENACILPNGQRRDYFKARRLRDLMARCSKEREKRPEFFVGFSDRWETRPKPSVVCRAVMVAEHFGAVMEHGPVHLMSELRSNVMSARQTLSGFQLLRRSEIIEVWFPLQQVKPGLKLTEFSFNNRGSLKSAKSGFHLSRMLPRSLRCPWILWTPLSPELQIC